MKNRRSKEFVSVTDIVSATYCEQKMIFDRERGDARPVEVRRQAAAGTRAHMRFETAGKARAAVDRRCFIATAVYGPEAPETQFLRGWRDRVLLPTALGRFAVSVYYALSPSLVQLLQRRPWTVATVRAGLNLVLTAMGMRK